MSQMTAVTARPSTITDIVLERIRLAIVTKQIPPGSAISETALATQLQVSKTPVRESLIRLTQIGLIENVGSRLRVVEPSPSNMRSAYEYRLALEPSATALSATRADSQSIAKIVQDAEATLECARAGDAGGYSTFSRTFHLDLAIASENLHFERSIGNCLALTQALRQRDRSTADGRMESADYHVKIAHAVRAGDATTAAELMRSHVMGLMEQALAPYESPESLVEEGE